MSAQRKFRDASLDQAVVAGPAAIWISSDDTTYRASPARMQQQALAAAFDGMPAPYIKALPGALRLAIGVGVCTGLWAMIVAAVGAVI